MSVLLTGGAGFIGSHTAVEMIHAGYDVIIADDLSNASPKVIDRIETISGTRPKFYQIDAADKAAMTKLFQENQIDAVIHFAGFKCVPESTKLPLKYYRKIGHRPDHSGGHGAVRLQGHCVLLLCNGVWRKQSGSLH